MKTAFAAVLLLAAVSASAAEAPRGRVKTKFAAGAKALLRKNGCAIEDGYLRAKGGDDKSTDLSSGGGALYAALNPKTTDTLAVAAYDHGRRYVTLEAGCEGAKPWVAPLELDEKAAAKLFPKTLK